MLTPNSIQLTATKLGPNVRTRTSPDPHLAIRDDTATAEMWRDTFARNGALGITDATFLSVAAAAVTGELIDVADPRLTAHTVRCWSHNGDGSVEIDPIDNGVASNSRLTASVGAVLLIALLVEGVTVFDVNSMFALHAFVGMMVIPVALLKICSTGYRFMKYYRKDPAYLQKGPPHVILRIVGPLVVVSTVSLLGTGAALLAVGPANSDTLVTVHQASFIVWVSVTTIHVLGHIAETWRLTIHDMRASSAGGVGGVGLRRGLILASLVVGLGLGTASLGWNSAWAHRVGRRDGALLSNPVGSGAGVGRMGASD